MLKSYGALAIILMEPSLGMEAVVYGDDSTISSMTEASNCVILHAQEIARVCQRGPIFSRKVRQGRNPGHF